MLPFSGNPADPISFPRVKGIKRTDPPCRQGASFSISQSVDQFSRWRLVSGVAFCALSYLCLTGFDWMALQYVGRPLTYPKAAIASFTALAIGHNLGVAALSSAPFDIATTHDGG